VNGVKDFLLALLPSAGVLFLFYLAMRAIFRADRNERAAVARLEKSAQMVGDQVVDPATAPAGEDSENVGREPKSP
jgi:threonine/homoserine/homoserine lactone efflux protein